MPKMKSHRGAAKRFRVTGSGKLRRLVTARNHVFGKSRRHKQDLGMPAKVEKADDRNVRRLLAK